MKRNILITIVALGMLITIIAGCDIGINPLILDGSVVGRTLHVDTRGLASFYEDTASFNLASVRDLSDKGKTIDSINFYNLTILIDSASLTPGGTKVTGDIIIDQVDGVLASDTIAVLTDAKISDFSSERSIFDPTLSSEVYYSAAGISRLETAFDNGSVVRVHVKGSSTNSPLVFDVHIKIYGQLWFEPK